MVKFTVSKAGQETTLSLNEGLIWKHPLESRFGLRRRLISANPRTDLLTLKRAREASHPSIPSLQPVDAIDAHVPWNSVRQCPQCAEHLFHPAIYQLPALPVCPIHRRPFTFGCPDCGHAWDRPLSVRHPRCVTCGCLSRRLWGQTRLPQKHYRALCWLSRWLANAYTRRKSQCHPTLFDIQRLTDPRSDVEGARFHIPLLSDDCFVAFESRRIDGIYQKRLSRLGVVDVPAPLKSRRSKLRLWHPTRFVPSGDSIIASMKASRSLSEDSPLLTLLCLALRRLLRWQQTALDFEHRLVWSDLRSVRPEAVREGRLPCPLCLAFSFWCRAVTLKFVSEQLGGSPGEHELCRFADYIHFPNIPEGVFVREESGRNFRPSKNFERWLFLRASDYAFLEFTQLALYLLRETKDIRVRFKPTGYRPSIPRFSYSNETSRFLEITQHNDQLTAVYWPRSPLDRVALTSEAIKRIERCQSASRSEDCSLIWGIAPDPKQLIQRHARQLLRVPVCRPALHPLLYPWRDQTPILKPNGQGHPYDLRAVVGETVYAQSIHDHES